MPEAGGATIPPEAGDAQSACSAVARAGVVHGGVRAGPGGL